MPLGIIAEAGGGKAGPLTEIYITTAIRIKIRIIKNHIHPLKPLLFFIILFMEMQEVDQYLHLAHRVDNHLLLLLPPPIQPYLAQNHHLN